MLGCDFCKVILAVCLSRGMEPFKDHPSTCGCLTSLRNKLQQSSLGNFQQHYLPELLANVYNYRWWWKCVLPWSRLFWDPVINKLSAISNLPTNNVSAMTASTPEPAYCDQFTLMIVDEYRDQEKCTKFLRLSTMIQHSIAKMIRSLFQCNQANLTWLGQFNESRAWLVKVEVNNDLSNRLVFSNAFSKKLHDASSEQLHKYVLFQKCLTLEVILNYKALFQNFHPW